MIEARSGKIPTTSVRRRISRLSRSLGLFATNVAAHRDKQLGVDHFGHIWADE
jgi:hypothetical protein